jgi:hypothetical protein
VRGRSGVDLVWRGSKANVQRLLHGPIRAAKFETNLKLLWSTVRCRCWKRRRQHGTIRPEGGLLEVEGCQRAAVRKLQEPARGIVGERRSRSGEIVEVDRVASTKILELRAKIRRSANPRSEQRRVVDH